MKNISSEKQEQKTLKNIYVQLISSEIQPNKELYQVELFTPNLFLCSTSLKQLCKNLDDLFMFSIASEAFFFKIIATHLCRFPTSLKPNQKLVFHSYFFELVASMNGPISRSSFQLWLISQPFK